MYRIRRFQYYGTWHLIELNLKLLGNFGCIHPSEIKYFIQDKQFSQKLILKSNKREINIYLLSEYLLFIIQRVKFENWR